MAQEGMIRTLGKSTELKYERSLVALLKACAKEKDVYQGSRIHADILNRGLLKKNIFVGNSLINMYAKCGAIGKAQEVFDELPVRDVVSWNTLTMGYSEHGQCEEALICYERMHHDGLSPDAVTFTCIVKACGSMGAAEKGKEIHAEIMREGLLRKDCVLGTALVDMYAKCGDLVKARQVFDELPVRDVVSWNALIAGYAQHGHGEEACGFYERMLHEGLSPNAVTFLSILKAYGSIGAGEKGKEIHAEIIRKGVFGDNGVLGNALVDMYAKCGALVKAQEVFDELPIRDVVSWTSLIAGYTQFGHGDEALIRFKQMQSEGLSPDAMTFACIFKACGSIRAAGMGIELHAEIVRDGFLGKDSVIGTALVDMYAKCGALAKAEHVFNELSVLSVAPWNALIAGFAHHDHGEKALSCFEQMQHEGLFPDALTFACILKACGSMGAIGKGNEVCAQIVREGLLGQNSVLGTAVVGMYGKCGAVAKAHQVFDELPFQDIVSWNALIAGYAQHDHGEEALNCFAQMQQKGLSPDAVTYLCILKACGSVGEAEKGSQLHAEIVREGLLGKNSSLGTALVDMYAKCGVLGKAQEVFDELHVRNVDSWNALISGYSQHGYGKEAVNCFEQMLHDRICPDAVTFLCTLSACSCSGLVDEGQKCFEAMIRSHGINPTLEHHTCMVDLFGRGGHFDRALAVIKKMPSSDCLPLWFTLLAACRTWGNVKVGRLAFEYAVQLDEKSAVAYVYMSNIYAAAGMQENADKIEAMRLRKEAWKVPGRCWWTDVNGNVHSFCVGDKGQGQAQTKSIYAKLEDMTHKVSREGYLPDLNLVSQDILLEVREVALNGTVRSQ